MLIIKNGRVIDPASGIDGRLDVIVSNGRIDGLGAFEDSPAGARIIDATGCIVAPGLIDMHVHFRDPGLTQKEDIFTGALSAAAGGVTTAVCMPNTVPVIDSAETVQYVLDRAARAAVRVLPYAAVTIGQKGEELTDFKALVDAGAVALSDDGNPVMDAAVMRRAMLLARDGDILISSHCEDAGMVRNFAVNEGRVSKKLGIPGRPAIAEEIMVARDAMLAGETGARVHIAHVSTANAVDIVRRAKAAGVRITAETCPQYFTLTEEEVLTRGALARVNPPLRTAADREAVIAGIVDGTIDAIVTDHAPHTPREKEEPLADAPSGMIGLETSLALALTALYHGGKLTLNRIIELMSVNPAGILRIQGGKMARGDAADLVVFDPNERWRVDASQFKSKARNTPFDGARLTGRVKYTVFGGEIVYGGK